MIRRWIGILEPTRPGQPGGDLVYWRGHLADHSRPITHEEFDKLRRRGLRNLRNFYRSLWGVAALLLVSFEMYRWFGEAVIYVVLANLGAFVLVLYSVLTLLLPALELLRVPRSANILTFPDHATSSAIEVIVPGRLLVQRGGKERLRPEVLELSFAAPPVPTEVSQLPRESWREPTPNEAMELARRRTENSTTFWTLCVATFNLILVVSRQLTSDVVVLVALFLLLLCVAGLLLASMSRRQSRIVPPRVRIVRNTIVNDRKVGWAEYVNGKLWTVEGEPADWRKR